MTPELTVLTYAALLQVVQFMLVGVLVNKELGVAQTLSPRDRDAQGGDVQDRLSPRAARLYRATDNHFEALILFTIAVVVISVSGQSTNFTAICAYTYLGARVAYIPAYAFGLAPWRSLIWAIGWLATILMLLAAIW